MSPSSLLGAARAMRACKISYFPLPSPLLPSYPLPHPSFPVFPRTPLSPHPSYLVRPINYGLFVARASYLFSPSIPSSLCSCPIFSLLPPPISPSCPLSLTLSASQRWAICSYHEPIKNVNRPRLLTINQYFLHPCM